MKLLKLRCYCCGEPIGDRFVVMTMGDGPVDRVFVAKEDHVERFDETDTAIATVIRDKES